jgi:hypothetical protein
MAPPSAVIGTVAVVMVGAIVAADLRRINSTTRPMPCGAERLQPHRLGACGRSNPVLDGAPVHRHLD